MKIVVRSIAVATAFAARCCNKPPICQWRRCISLLLLSSRLQLGGIFCWRERWLPMGEFSGEHPLDYAMPGMNGMEVARQVKSRFPTLPVLFITGYVDSAALREIGDAKIIKKPFVEGTTSPIKWMLHSSRVPVARAERSCRSDGSNPPRMRR